MKLAALFVLGATAAFSAAITGTATYDVVLTSSSTALTFAAAGANALTTTGTGSPTGPNFIQTTLAATATNYVSGFGVQTNAVMNLTAGPGTSFSNAFADALSGVIRVTNSGSSTATYNVVSQAFQYSLQTTGPTFAALGASLGIERFNTATSTWDVIGVTSFGLGTDDLRQICVPKACAGGASSYTLAGNSTADLRIHTRLTGSASQVADSAVDAVTAAPEPGSFLLLTSAAALLALRHRRRR